MASIINAATSGGLISTADTSGILQLQTAGTTAVTVDASQNVGVGVTPSAWSVAYPNILQTEGGSIFGDPAGSEGNYGVNVYYNAGYKYAANGYASVYQQYNSQHIFKTAVTGTAGNAISFTNSLVFGKGTTLALEGASTGTGTGITFPATQSASTDANTLDDYEEGIWTPTFTTAGGSITFNNRYGTYVKIGKLVTVTVFFSITSVSSPTGRFQVTNLPFTAASGSTYSSAGGVSPYTMAAGAYMIALEIDPGTTSAIYFNFANGVRYECSPYFQASGQIVSTLSYQV